MPVVDGGGSDAFARVITGLTVEKALLLTGEDLLRIMGGLP